jgi:hypothetical protein
MFSVLNKIKFLNSGAFQGLNKLTHVWLYGNLCINENFQGPTRIAVLQKTVNGKCHFDESKPTAPVPAHNKKVQVLEATIVSLTSENKDLKKQLEAAKESCN